MSIRKISIGPDYKNAMHYSIGQPIIKGSTISNIILNELTSEYDIWITNSANETAKYKSFPKAMASVEYDVNHFLEPKP